MARRIDNEKLIELVKSYPFLYDLADRRYGDSERKNVAWKEIADQLHLPEKYCRKSWALLRDSYRRALKKRKECGQPEEKRRKWRYEVEMSFLLPFLRERSTTNTEIFHENNDSGDGENSSCEDNEGKSASLDVSSQGTVLPKQEQICDETVAEPSLSTERQTFSEPSENNRPLLKRARVRQKTRFQSTNETLSNSLMKFILENKAKNDDIQQFFESIATTVRSFPPRDRAIAKAKVFDVISEMEIDILNRDASL
ncbi:transcription factor Adf-1-like [Coccinella septempunctata]|uniref:transcription factor Adf-1-like n=1 Tax=Coccinella septempunctata TaxID=41139 RepID=UPI001D099411|nr:transcription factor Adf-1-like [Coccinella septempunctata]